MRLPGIFFALAMGLTCGFGQPLDIPAPPPTQGIDLALIGKVKPRTAKAIPASSWSIGGETLDRDFAVYENYRPYLGPLGAKGIRFQAGWAKCEPCPGVYEWAWLDVIINDAIAQGVQPWVELSYGNTNYLGGGDTGLGGGLPSSSVALAAWDKWASTLVDRYKDQVNEWEIWNEPDLNRAGTATVAAYAQLFIRTARLIRGIQPRGRIYALALAHDMAYARRFLELLKEQNQLHLVDAITVHTYPRNPDDMSHVDALREAIAGMGHPIQVRQGETGAPSKFQENFALSKIEWTENTQAKWNLRRLMAHHARGVPMNLFTISDMHYSGPKGTIRMNYKGLLGTRPDKTISHVKQAYSAAQHVFTIFDSSLQLATNYAFRSSSGRKLAVSAYRDGDQRQACVFWHSESAPTNQNRAVPIDLTLASGRFKNPVVVDLRTGLIYGLPAEKWNVRDDGVRFTGLPVYDCPMIIAERDLIPSIP